MTIATSGLLAVAAAQLYLAHEQTKLAETVARLELAKEKPRIKITPSRDVARSGGAEPGTFVELPEHFYVKLVSGIDTIFSIDVPITLHVSDDNGATSCLIEVRGLYVQDDQRQRLNLFSPPREDFAELIHALREKGVEFNYPTWDFVVRYFDLYGNLKTDYLGLRLQPEHPPQRALILYNGIWSNGEGFYFDEAPSKWCPSISHKLESAIQKLGGASGNFGQPAENLE